MAPTPAPNSPLQSVALATNNAGAAVSRTLFGGLTAVGVQMMRAAYAMGLGITFNGNRNLYETFGYNTRPMHVNFLQKYLRQGVATRVIDAPVDALWTDIPTLEGTAEFESAWTKLLSKHAIFPALAQADRFAGLGMYSVLVIGIDDGRQLDQPVNTARTNNIIFLQPYLEGSVEIIELDQNPFSPRFGMPVMYKVTPRDIMTKNSSLLMGKTQQAFRAHWTRVLHLADRTLESPIYGHSRLEPIYNDLDDLQKVSGGSAETYWLTANRGLHVDIDKDLELDEDDAGDLSDEIDEYQHGLRRIIRTRGTKVTNLGSDIADPKGPFTVIISLISAATGIPQRVLLGAEAGQLASQQDRANWANRCAERIANWGEPKVLKPFVGKLQDMKVLPGTIDKVSIKWAETFKMNPLERGQTSAQQARSITNVARAMETAQKIQVDLISVEEAREMTAPGDQLLVLGPVPNGTATYPPRLSAPYNDPQNKLDEIDKQGELAKEAAERIAKNPELAPKPFGGDNAQAD
jgi:hypothetical protein